MDRHTEARDHCAFCICYGTILCHDCMTWILCVCDPVLMSGTYDTDVICLCWLQAAAEASSQQSFIDEYFGGEYETTYPSM